MSLFRGDGTVSGVFVGDRAASAVYLGDVQVWPDGGEVPPPPEPEITVIELEGYLLRMAVAPDGKTVYLISEEALIVMDASRPDMSVVNTVDLFYPCDVACDWTSSRVLVSSYNESNELMLNLFDATGGPVGEVPLPDSELSDFIAVTYTSNSEVAYATGRAKVWEIGGNNTVTRFAQAEGGGSVSVTTTEDKVFFTSRRPYDAVQVWDRQTLTWDSRANLVPDTPQDLAVSPDNAYVFVSLSAGVYRFDPDDASIAGTSIVVYSDFARSIAMKQDGTRLYVAVNGGVAVVGTDTYEVIGYYILPSSYETNWIRLSGDGSKLFALVDNSFVHVVPLVEEGDIWSPADAPSTDSDTLKTFSTPGMYSYIIPDWAEELEVVVLGGGGGGTQGGAGFAAGPGGGAGSWKAVTWKAGTDFTPGTSVNVVVGAGGKGGANGTVIPNKGQDGRASLVSFIGPNGTRNVSAAGGLGNSSPNQWGASPGKYVFAGSTYQGGVTNAVSSAPGGVPGAGGSGSNGVAFVVGKNAGDGGYGRVWIRAYRNTRQSDRSARSMRGGVFPPFKGWEGTENGFART